MSHSNLSSKENLHFSASKAAMEGPLQAPKLFDKTWENVQKKSKKWETRVRSWFGGNKKTLGAKFNLPLLKAFTNWINNKLKLKQVAPLENIETDFGSGEKLIQLLGKKKWGERGEGSKYTV